MAAFFFQMSKKTYNSETRNQTIIWITRVKVKRNCVALLQFFPGNFVFF